MSIKIKEMNRRKEYIIACFLALLAGISLNLRMTIFTVKQLEKSADITGMHSWFRLVWDFKMSLEGYSIKEFLITCGLFFLFYKALQVQESRIRKLAVIPGVLFAFFEVFGTSFKETAGWSQIFETTRNLCKAGVKFIGLFFLFYAICILILYCLDHISFVSEETASEKSWFTCNVKSFFVVFALILLMWLPYAVADFPGLTNYDFFDELDTFYGNDTNSLRVVVPISDEVTLNNNNPVLQTMFAVTAMKIGDLLGSPYIGIFVFCYL